VVGLGHEVTMPYDAASGLPAGRRAHSPLVITKYVDKSSPRLYQALAETRSMNLTIRYFRSDREGREEPYYTMMIQNARVANMRMAYPNIEQVSFLYETIRWTYEPDGIEFEDDWTQPI
jgi:type VI secretion system secreted protein Hcp